MADVWGPAHRPRASASARSARAPSTLVTAVADAYLDRAPLVALTGQGDLERMHKESHQYIDLQRVMRPITKWNARLSDPAIILEVVRKAFKVAEGEKPPTSSCRGRDGGRDRGGAAAPPPPRPPRARRP